MPEYPHEVKHGETYTQTYSRGVAQTVPEIVESALKLGAVAVRIERKETRWSEHSSGVEFLLSVDFEKPE